MYYIYGCCANESFSASPRDWARHLDGCAMLIKAAGINGVVGGMRQAIFWCFARMGMFLWFRLRIPANVHRYVGGLPLRQSYENPDEFVVLADGIYVNCDLEIQI